MLKENTVKEKERMNEWMNEKLGPQSMKSCWEWGGGGGGGGGKYWILTVSLTTRWANLEKEFKTRKDGKKRVSAVGRP